MIGMLITVVELDGVSDNASVCYCTDRSCLLEARGIPKNESLRERVAKRWFNR